MPDSWNVVYKPGTGCTNRELEYGSSMYVGWMVGAPIGSQCACVGRMLLVSKGICPLCAYLTGELMLFTSSGNSNFPAVWVRKSDMGTTPSEVWSSSIAAGRNSCSLVGFQGMTPSCFSGRDEPAAPHLCLGSAADPPSLSVASLVCSLALLWCSCFWLGVLGAGVRGCPLACGEGLGAESPRPCCLSWKQASVFGWLYGGHTVWTVSSLWDAAAVWCLDYSLVEWGLWQESPQPSPALSRSATYFPVGRLFSSM